MTYFEALTAAAFLRFRAGASRSGRPRGRPRRTLRRDERRAGAASRSSPRSRSTTSEELGPTLSAIAREKAGIFRARAPGARRALGRRPGGRCARGRGGGGRRLARRGAEIRVAARARSGLDGTRFHLTTPASGAATCGRRFPARTRPGTPRSRSGPPSSVAGASRRSDADAVARRRRGRPVARAPGVARGPRAPDRSLDGCHNAEGAAALAGFLDDAGPRRRCRLVFGAMADKDVEGIAAALFPAVPARRRSCRALARARRRREELAGRMRSLRAGTESRGGSRRRAARSSALLARARRRPYNRRRLSLPRRRGARTAPRRQGRRKDGT